VGFGLSVPVSGIPTPARVPGASVFNQKRMNQKLNREHSFDIELAVIVGIEKAILLKNFDHWVRENERRSNEAYFIDGSWWTSESLNSLVKKYPYFKSRSSIARWVKELAADCWLTIAAAEREVNYYRPGLVFSLWNAGENWEAELEKVRLSQNGTGEDCTKMGQPLYQNGTTPVPKWDSYCTKMGHFNIDNIEGNVELNIEADFEKKEAEVKGKKSRKKSAEYTDREVAAFLEIDQQVFFTEILRNGAWNDYLEYRITKDRFRYKDAKSHALAVKNLFMICSKNPELAQAVVDQSRANGWTGLHPLKNQQLQTNNKKSHVDEQYKLANAVFANRKG